MAEEVACHVAPPIGRVRQSFLIRGGVPRLVAMKRVVALPQVQDSEVVQSDPVKALPAAVKTGT